MFTTSSNRYLVFLYLSPVMWYCSFLNFLLSQEIVADDELAFVGMLLLDTMLIDSCHRLAIVMKWLTIIFWFLFFFFGIPALKRAYVFLAGVATILNTTHTCDHFQREKRENHLEKIWMATEMSSHLNFHLKTYKFTCLRSRINLFLPDGCTETESGLTMLSS